MEQNQIEELCNATDDKAFHKFAYDYGWKYETEEDLRAAYARKAKSTQGIPLTEKEFLVELGFGDVTEGHQLYARLYPLVEKGALKAFDLYEYARLRWCFHHPEAVIACEIGPKRWVVNNCGEKTSPDRAKLLLNKEWGFEVGGIEILGTPYYDATDWNFIRFRCRSVEWVMCNDSLYQVYQ